MEPVAGERQDLIIGVEDKMSLKDYIIYGLQQVLVESSGMTFPVVVGVALKLPRETIQYMVQAYMIGSGLVTITQSTSLLKLPVVQGPAAVFLALVITVGGMLGTAVAWTAMVIAGAISTVMAWPLGWWGKLRPIIAAPPIYGPLITLIGLSLTGVVIGLIVGRPGTPGFASGVNGLLAAMTFLIAVVLVLFFRRGFLRFGAILIAVAIGSIVGSLAGKANFAPVAGAAWFGLPRFLPFGWEVNIAAIVVMFLGYAIALIESMGNYILVGEIMAKQHIDEARINRGILGEAAGSTLAALIGGSGATSYGQNIGAISVTGVGSRHVITTAGIIVLVLGFIPKFAAVVASIPPAVLGGVYILTWGMLIMQGIRIFGRMQLTNLNMVIAGSTFMVGMGAYFL
ncbi:MAG: solute carrier family 23 protein, partial [Candidatus Korobacteraceae bacterium]